MKEKNTANPRREDCLQGTFLANAKGFGFVSVEGREDDLFIPEERTGTALDGDLVEVLLLAEPRGSQAETARGGREHRQEAEVVRIVQRNTTRVVGTFYGRKGAGSVIPDNRKIPADVRIEAGQTLGAVNGHKVVARITDYGESAAAAGQHASVSRSGPKLVGRIEEILGHMDDPGVDILSIIRAYELPGAFPEEVMEEVRVIPQVIPTDRKTLKGREDWQEVLTVTIDGPDTKDIDDAISIRKRKEDDGRTYWELGVHIADVAQYVTEGSPLDREALNRGTSHYLVDRVIPMLPHELSNGICSLNPGEDRLALSCIMELDRDGAIVDSRVAETIIRSDAKLSYPGVMKLFKEGDESEILTQLLLQQDRAAQSGPDPEDEGDSTAQSGLKSGDDEGPIAQSGPEAESGGESPLRETAPSSDAVRPRRRTGCKMKAHAIAAMLRRGRRLSAILTKKRAADGAIDFEFPECKILLNEQGHVTDIVSCERNEATLMIENFMVAANETVARTFCGMDIPFVYRTHAKPTEEKMRELQEFVQGYGVTFRWKRGASDPKQVQKLLQSLQGRPEEAAIRVKTLRSMQRAVYTTDCGGHFGLALEYYCHFTSPIRRYPDLQIHRIIKEQIHGKLGVRRRAHYEKILPDVCDRCSQQERRADEAERETDKQKMCEYMKEHLGEVFEGAVSGVTGWGLYVQLPNTIEGMIPVRSLRDDYYVYDETSLRLVGERTGKAYSLGQIVRVQVSSVDTAARRIDFEPEGLPRAGGRRSGENTTARGDAGGKPKKPDAQGGDAAHRHGKKRGRRKH